MTAPASSRSPIRWRSPIRAAVVARRLARRGRRTVRSSATPCLEWCLVDAIEIGTSAAAAWRHGDGGAVPRSRRADHAASAMSTVPVTDLVERVGRPGPGAAAPSSASSTCIQRWSRSSTRGRRWPRRSWRCWPRVAASVGSSSSDQGALTMLTAGAATGAASGGRHRGGRDLEAARAPADRGRRPRSSGPPVEHHDGRPRVDGRRPSWSGLTRRPRISSRADDRLAVIGMGKLGGAELNYASDVDLLLVGRGRPRSPRASRSRPARSRRPMPSASTLDLRPEGRDGPLVRSLDVLRGLLGAVGASRGSARPS